METNKTSTASGVGAASSRLWSTILEGVEYRSQLAALELREEQNRLATLVLAASGAALSVIVALLCLNAYILIAFWEQRVGAALVLTCSYLLLGLALAWLAWRKSKGSHAPFAATVEELKRDQDALALQGGEP